MSQYMLGGNLFMASVLNIEGMSKYYLPPGLWTDFFTGKEYEGDTWVEEQPPYPGIPLMVRENSVMAIGALGERADKGYLCGCEFRVYAVRDGMKIDADACGPDNTVGLSISLRRDGRTITVTSDGRWPYTLRMVNMCAHSAVNGFLTVEGNDSIVTPDRGASVIEISF